jgi:hypothetical protein
MIAPARIRHKTATSQRLASMNLTLGVLRGAGLAAILTAAIAAVLVDNAIPTAAVPPGAS